MTCVSLFDILARDDGGSAPGRVQQIVHFAHKLVTQTLAEWERVLEYEQQFSATAYRAIADEDEIEGRLRAIYEQWSGEARQVLDRTRRLAAAGRPVDNAELLEDAYASVAARLKLTPEMVVQAMAQVRAGQAIPLKELRDELDARIRA